MIDDLDELRRVLSRTPLSDAPHATALPVLDTGALAFAIDPGALDPLEAWRAARSVVNETGRWPLIVQSFTGKDWSHPMFAGVPWEERVAEGDLFSRWGFGDYGDDEDDDEGGGLLARLPLVGRFFREDDEDEGEEHGPRLDQSIEAIIGRSREVDVDAFLAEQAREWDEEVIEDVDEDVAEVLEDMQRRLGWAPDTAAIEAARSADRPLRSIFDVEAWLFEREQEKFPLTGPEEGPSHIDWHEGPFPRSLTFLLLIPTADGADALAYLSWYGCDGVDAAPYVAMLRRWHERWGAELVAHEGTMLRLLVDRPPADAESAWQVSLEQTLVAPDTIVLPGVTRAQHARTLLGRDRWFLHSKP